MSATAFDRIVDKLTDNGAKVRTAGEGRASAQCPAHDDKTPSLSVTRIEGSVLLHCHGGCDTGNVLAALGLGKRDLFDDTRGANYNYADRSGTIIRTVSRTPGKKFFQSGDTTGQPTLYRLPQVAQAVTDDQVVYLVEGEKDVHALESIGLIATTAPMGADSFDKVDASPLHGAKVVAVVDKDSAGQKWAALVTDKLDGMCQSLTFVQAADGKDAADHIAAGHGVDDLVPLEPPVDDLEHVRQRFPRLDIAALLSADRPPREWVIPGLIPAGAAVALIAPAGTGKSLLLLGCMIGVARGDRTFAGLPIPRARRVVLIDMENTEDDLADRLLALGITPADVAELDNLVIIHLPPLAPLDTEVGGLELAVLLDAYGIKAGDVVVLDSLQRVVKGPENDSDTLRAFYRCTGMELKKRGLAVVRTDNTGKDTDKGARGTSGKRDDVDIELILTRDADHPDRLRIKPGKSRLPDIISVLINRDVDDDGHLTFTTAGDPFRTLVGDAHRVLELLNIAVETGERKAAETIKASGQNVVRAALRVAIKERKNPLWTVAVMSEMPAPSTHGVPPGTEVETDRAEQSRRTYGAPPENGESEHENRAKQSRRTLRADDVGAPADSAPPLPLSKERRAGARDLPDPLICPCGQPISDKRQWAGKVECVDCEAVA